MDDDELPLRMAPVPVRVVPLEARVTSAPLTVTGRFFASRAVLLKSPSSGFAEGLDLVLGERVEKNQTLCSVGEAMARQRALSSEASVHQLEAQLAERDDLLAAAKERKEPEERLASFESKQRAAAHKVAHEKLQRDRNEMLVRAVVVRAPFAGRVSAVHAAPGATVMSGHPLVELVAIDPITLVLEVPTWVVGRCPVGSEVEVVSASSVQPHVGRIARWSPTAVDELRRVEIDVDNPDATVAAGETATARLRVGEREAFFAPRAGLHQAKEGLSLQLVEHSRVHVLRVRAFGGDALEVEVAGALSASQLVVMYSERPLVDQAEVVIRGDH